LHVFALYHLLGFEGKLALCIGCCISVLSVFGHRNYCSAWSSIKRAEARICENVEWNRNCDYIQICCATVCHFDHMWFH